MSREEGFEQLIFRTEINAIEQGKIPDSFPLHWHKDIEMLLLREEATEPVTVIVGLDEIEMHPGDVILIWPGELHEIRNNKFGDLAALQFPITLLNERRCFAVMMNVLKSCRLLIFEKNPELNQNLLMLANQIFRIFSDSSRAFSDIEMLISLYEMFIAIGTMLQGMELLTEAAHSDKMQEKIILACEYIRTNFDSNITLDSAAEFAGFSPCYFSRYFKKVTSYNFVEFLTIQRVKRLQILLADTNLSITDAAYQAGFRSISTLNRVFRQYSGCSPSEYRKCYKV